MPVFIGSFRIEAGCGDLAGFGFGLGGDIPVAFVASYPCFPTIWIGPKRPGCGDIGNLIDCGWRRRCPTDQTSRPT
jgi:hypothetical protein